MKNFKIGVLLSLLLCVMTFASCARIDAGYVGIKVNMAGDQKGVNDFPAVTGWVFYAPWLTQIEEYPTFMQSYVYTANSAEGKAIDESITFSDKDQIPVNADVNVSYTLDGAKAPHFYIKFRNDDIKAFTHGYMRNTMRDAFNIVASRYVYDDINGLGKEKFMKEVRAMMNEDLNLYGITVEQLGFVGALRPPNAIRDAITLKLKANQDAQRTENELRQSTAEAMKVVAKAKGEADANKLLAESLTPVLMEWRKLAVTEAAVAKWDGKRPTVEGAGSGMLLSIDTKK
jgi:regulator of protease activity HflC (stomatin/prohibitin superfamily)